MKKLRAFLLIGCTMTLLIGCAGRLPSNSRATSLMRKHFNHYAKKYKESSFGKKKVTSIELLGIEEIHYKLVAVTAFITMDKSDVHKVRVTFEKGPFGWRTVDWENLGGD